MIILTRFGCQPERTHVLVNIIHTYTHTRARARAHVCVCMNDSTNRCVVVSNKFLACIYVQLRALWNEKRFFDIFRDCASMGYKVTFGVRDKVY